MDMTTELQASTETIHAPLRYSGHYACPRCRGRLFFDGEELVCVTCGYEHDPSAALSGRIASSSR